MYQVLDFSFPRERKNQKEKEKEKETNVKQKRDMSKEISKRDIVRKRGKERDCKKGRNKSVSFNKEAEKN